MPWVSPISLRCTIIGESNYRRFTDDSATPEGCSRGRVPRDYREYPEGSGVAGPFPLKIIPRDEWPARIEELTRKKLLLSDLRRHYQIPSLHQNGTNYCWINAVVHAFMLMRAKAGLPYVKLSPASGGGPIKNFKNVGGWGGEALDYIIKYGVCEEAIWPANAIDKRYWTDEAKENALLYRATKWGELKPRNFEQYMTALLHRLPVPIGLNWWSHEVCGMDPVIIKHVNDNYYFGSKIWNSWGDDWSDGDEGEAVLDEKRSTPDDAVVILDQIAYAA